MIPQKKNALGRRNFLRALGSASTAAAAVATLPMTATEANAYDPGNQETRARYRADSPDVQAFYRTNGYETLKK
jgi:hypothetical protein